MKSIKFVVVLLIFLSLLIVANGNEIHSDYETGILTSEYTNSSDIQSLTTMSEENRQSIFLKKSILMETVFTVPAITSYNGNLYFLSDWYYSDTGKHSIELMKSSDYGDSWSNPVTVTEENGSMFKSMTSDKTAIYVTYSKGNDIYFQKSTDGGLSFSGPEIIGSAEHLIQFVPNIILDSNDVYVIYSSSPDKKTVVSVILKTSDGGNTWEKIDEIPSDSAVCIYKKLIYKFSIQNGIINFRTSNDAGNSWSGLQPVHLGEQIIEVSADNNDIHLLYIKDRYLFHTFSLNGGITWSAPVRIDTDVLGHDAIINHLETTSDAIYVLYNKYNGIQYNSFDLWFKESSDNGLTWSSPVKVGKDVGVPTIESDDKYIYVVGHDGDKSSSTYSHVCLYKYFKSATNPSPVIVNLETEPWSHEKETATISVTVKNEGGFSSEGHISVSFPNGEEVVSVSGTGDTHIIYPTGSTIWGKSGQIDSSEYPLVELVKYGWSGGESETINIEVKPNELSDEMIFYIRAALKNYENADYERIPFSGIYEDQQKFPVEKHSIINKDTTEVFIIIDNDNKYKVEILFHEDSENKNLAEMFEGGLHKRFSVKDLHIYDIEEINVFDTTNNLVTDKQEVKRVLRALSGWLLAKHDQENNSGMSVFERLDYESEGVFTEIIESKQTVLGLSKNLACPLEFWQKNILWEESLQNSVGYSLSQGGNPPGLSDEESELIDGIVKDIVEGLDEEGKAIVDGFIRAMVKSAIVTDEGINYLRTIQEFYAYSDEQTNEFEKAIATTINKYDEENDEKRLEENLKGFLKDLLKDKGNEQLNEILKVGLKEIQNHLSEKSAAVFGKVVSGVGMGYTIANILIDGCGVFECAIDQTSSIYVLKEYGVAEKQLSEHLATSKTIDLQESYTYISLRKMEFSTLSYSYQQLADMNDVSVYAKLLSKTLPKLGITADKNEILKVSADWRNMAYDPEHATEFLYSCTPGYRDYTIEPAISSIVMFPGEEKIIKLQIRPSVSYVEYQVFYLNEVGKPSVTLSKPLNTEEETFFYVTIDAAKNIRPDRYHGTILINTQEKSFQYYLDINVIPEDQLKVDIVNLECNQYITSSEPTEIMVYVSNKGRPITGADVKANIYGSTSNTIEVLTLAEKGTGYYSTTFNAFYPEIYDVFVIANKRHTFNLLGYSPGSDSVNSLWSYDKKVKEDAFSGEIYPDTKIEKVDNIDTLEIYIQYELDWEGSDLNLHLYDSQGRHTGINEYGEIETQIPTSKYSGNVKPEWITIENSSLINMVTVVIEAIDVPISGEEYTLVKKYVTNESIFIVGSDEDKVSVGGSSGGGGGGGTTGENFENIAYKNVLNEFVSAGSVTSYDFDNEQNAIEYIRFKAFRNWGQISSTIEMLHNRSALVDVDAPDTVYCNVNLWVGKSGFSSSDNIEDPVVGFKVKKSWIEQNSIDEDTIRLCRYSDGQWSDLQTQKISEDDNYLHFEASTPGFSPFAIVGTSRKYIVDENIEVLKSTEDGSLAEDKDDFAITNPDSKPVNGVAIGLLFILLIGGIAGYVMYRKRG